MGGGEGGEERAVVNIVSKLHKLGNHLFCILFKLFDAQMRPFVFHGADNIYIEREAVY